MWATFVIFKKLPKANNHQMGENSPNLVTLMERQGPGNDLCFQSNRENRQLFYEKCFFFTKMCFFINVNGEDKSSVLR
jgi:hypothetical protein